MKNDYIEIGIFEFSKVALYWLPKLFLGSALLAGTGIGLGSAIFASAGNENVELTSNKIAELEKESPDSEQTNNDVDVAGAEDPVVSNVKENLDSISIVEGGKGDSSESVAEKTDPSRISTPEIPKKKSKCLIYTLLSSSSNPWKFGLAEDGDEFLSKNKKSSTAYKRISDACDRANGGDILVSNEYQSIWSSYREWDYRTEKQNHKEFKSHLSKQKEKQ